MIIRSVEYAGTVAEPDGPLPSPAGLPQIAFSGRSNVGKSSLINTLLRRTQSKVARVSSRPGKTQALNFYLVNDLFFLVDLPGYGFARVPEATRHAWAELIEWYLGTSGHPVGVVHLVDARHEPTRHDLHMVGYLAEVGLPAVVALTKIDKLKRGERGKSLSRAESTLQVDGSQLIPFSSKTGEGRSELLEAITELVEGDGHGADG